MNSPWGKLRAVTNFESQSRFNSISEERMIPLLRTRGVRGGIPTPVAVVLMTCAKRPQRVSGMIGGCIHATGLHNLGFLHIVPPIIGKRRTTYRTSSAGFALMDYWLSTDKHFQKFYDVYVSKKDKEECLSWSAMLAMGIDPPAVSEAKKKNEEILAEHAKLEAQRQADLQKYMAHAQGQYAQNMDHAKYTYTQGLQYRLSGFFGKKKMGFKI